VNDEELEVRVTVRRGHEVRKKKFVRYLPRHKSLSHFFDNLLAEMNVILEEIIRR